MKQILLSMFATLVAFLVLSSLYGDARGPFEVVLCSKILSSFSIAMFAFGICGLAHHAQVQREKGIPLLYQSLGFPLHHMLRFPLTITAFIACFAIFGENVAFPWGQNKLQETLDQQEWIPEEGNEVVLDFASLYKRNEGFVVLGKDWVLTTSNLKWTDEMVLEDVRWYGQSDIDFRASSLKMAIKKPSLVKDFLRESSIFWSIDEPRLRKELYKRTTLPLCFVLLGVLVYRFVLQFSRAAFFSCSGILLFWGAVRCGDLLYEWGALLSSLFPLVTLLFCFLTSICFWREG